MTITRPDMESLARSSPLWDQTSAPRFREADGWPGRRGERLATAHRVGLDVATGIVTSLRPLDGDRNDLGFDVEILEVDGDVQPELDRAAEAEAARAALPQPPGPGWAAQRSTDQLP